MLMVKISLKKNLFFFNIILLTGVGYILSACNGGFITNEKLISEGEILFDVSYPYYDGNLASFMPSQMNMKFKDNSFITDISLGSLFGTKIISIEKSKTLSQELNYLGDYHAVLLNESETPEALRTFPEFTMFETDKTDSIAGYLCHKIRVEFDDMELQGFDLYYTNEIGIENPNWCNPYFEIDGVLLQYEIQKYGIRTRFVANEVQEVKIESSDFDLNADCKQISFEEMDKKIESIFN